MKAIYIKVNLGLIVLGVGAVMAPLLWAHAAPPASKTLRAERFEIVGKDGKAHSIML